MAKALSILAVAALLACCFAGLTFADETDAAEMPYTVSVTTEVSSPWEAGVTLSNAYYGNNVTIEDGVITGSVTSGDKADATADALGLPAVEGKDYFLVFTISGLPEGFYVSYPNAYSTGDSDKVKSSKVGEGEKPTDFTMLYRITADNKVGEFTFAVTASPQTSLTGLQTYEIPMDLKMDVVEKQIEYTVNGLTIIDKVDSGTAYSLVALDALNQDVPAGQKFIGWSDGSNTYPVGTVLIIANEMTYEYEAVFEALPAIIVTFIDGTSKVSECNVTEIATKTPVMEKIGYDFLGWYLNGVVVDPLTYVFTESATLVAGWEPIKCFVTFTLPDGTVYQKQTVEYNDFATQPVLPEGCSGWDYDFATPVTGDITVKAIEAPAPEPTGMDKASNQVLLIVVAFLIIVVGAVAFLKRDEISARIVNRLDKREEGKDE